MKKFLIPLFFSINVLFLFGDNSVATLDCSGDPAPIRKGHIKRYDKASLDAFDVNSRYWLRNGKPWLPVMGEMHYSRYPHRQWEQQIQKIKASGVNIIATYVFWNYHEPSLGNWDWEGDRNLRAFIELCKKNELLVWLRIGPYCNAEAVNGGLPTWADKPGKRNNTKWYQALVRPYYQQVAKQVKGLLYRDGGPIFALQVENEYDDRPAHNADHIDWLRDEALAAGMVVPFFSITANTVFHNDQFGYLPLQGGYCYRGWEKAGGVATPGFAYDNDKWAIQEALGQLYYDLEAYPRGLCEQGTGSPMKSKDRFFVDPEIIYAYTQNQIGRGMNLLGYYMYQGGTHPVGLNRSIEGWPLNYDFQAPYSQFGKKQVSQPQLKALHLFLNQYGAQLAPMQVFSSSETVSDPYNKEKLRFCGRFKGESGFVFVNNAQVRLEMPQKEFKIELKFKNSSLTFPSGKMVLKDKENAILPVNLDLGGANLVYSTLQPLTSIVNGDSIDTFFFNNSSSVGEMAFSSDLKIGHSNGIKSVSSQNASIQLLQVVKPEGGTQRATLTIKVGKKRIRLIVLTKNEALNSWKYERQGKEWLLVTDDTSELLFKPDGVGLYSYGKREARVLSIPMLSGASPYDKVFSQLRFKSDKVSVDFALSKLKLWEATLKLPKKLPKGVSNYYLDLDYRGGSADLFIDGKLYSDHFYYGRPWQIGLIRFMDQNANELKLKLGHWNITTEGLPKWALKEMKCFAYIKSAPIVVEYEFELPIEK